MAIHMFYTKNSEACLYISHMISEEARRVSKDFVHVDISGDSLLVIITATGCGFDRILISKRIIMCVVSLWMPAVSNDDREQGPASAAMPFGYLYRR